METEDAIRYFGTRWEAEIEPPEGVMNQLDITKYRVLVSEKLGKRQPYLESGNTREDALNSAAVLLLIRNAQIGQGINGALKAADAHLAPFSLWRLKNAILNPALLQKAQQDREEFRRLKAINDRYNDQEVIEKSITTDFSVEERRLGETVELLEPLYGEGGEDLHLWRFRPADPETGREAAVIELVLEDREPVEKIFLRAKEAEAYYVSYTMRGEDSGGDCRIRLDDDEVQALVTGEAKSIEDDDGGLVFRTREDAERHLCKAEGEMANLP